MEKKEFSKIRKKLAKTQKQLAALLGMSLKTIHSYEQGWRSIPAHIERQLFFLLIKQRGNNQELTPAGNKKSARRKKIVQPGNFRADISAGFYAEPCVNAPVNPLIKKKSVSANPVIYSNHW